MIQKIENKADLIETIKENNYKNDALLTMILDEFQGIYNLKEENRVYELDRLRGPLVTTLYMIAERTKNIDDIVDSIMNIEVKELNAFDVMGAADIIELSHELGISEDKLTYAIMEVIAKRNNGGKA
ncbi:hypothetical protein [Lactococcus taiwanensis]|uniref:hypothetical protein n=1 Tax=Lactococcus taiwanensis TaxID=1151742 RepID=UPI0028A63067|nr:hypothetical protein [Lactococcus taiwanensis]